MNLPLRLLGVAIVPALFLVLLADAAHASEPRALPPDEIAEKVAAADMLMPEAEVEAAVKRATASKRRDDYQPRFWCGFAPCANIQSYGPDGPAREHGDAATAKTDRMPVVILQSLSIGTPCFSQPWPGFSFPRIAFVVL